MINASLESCFSFVNSHTSPSGRTVAKPHFPRAITISRQAGCGAILVAEKLAHHLQQHSPPGDGKWTVFDRELMDKVLSDHNLPKYLARFLPEDRASQVEDTLADIFGVHPPTRKVVQQTAETMLQLAELGSAILIGRAGNIVTAKLPDVLHVRLVAPLEDRIERICRDDQKTPAEARRFCLEEEQARTRYVKSYFNADINNALLYHLVINTSRVGCENAARIIADAALRLGQA
ncbi:MAG: cytidylate kinase-like family protein [Verrucomicrobiota bacterium]|jgi:cytidylate kinase